MKETIDGVLLVDKPAGWTSHDVVARVRRLLRLKRVGHTGTLDPSATGLLVLLLGRATRLAQFLSSADKKYEAIVRFSYMTDTGDATGAPRPTTESSETTARCAWDEMEIQSVLHDLRGQLEQVPPMYSAKKIKGVKLYELARRGYEIERRSVIVNIYELEAMSVNNSLLRHNADGTCDLAVRVACSAGTYVRVLAEEIGTRLNSAAHLAALRRTRAGSFDLADAVGLEKLQEMFESGALSSSSAFLSPDAALSAMPFVHLNTEDARRVRHGMDVHARGTWPDGEHLRLRDGGGELIAVGIYERRFERVRPRVVIAPAQEED